MSILYRKKFENIILHSMFFKLFILQFHANQQKFNMLMWKFVVIKLIINPLS